MTPNDNTKDIEKYNQALNNTLDNKKVKNIAFYGSYGADNSSFIKTFEKGNSQYKFLDVSLATFDKENADNSGSGGKSVDLSLCVVHRDSLDYSS